jgi:hypothetical protein
MANGWFALIGVVVGGLLNAGITIVLRRSDDKRSARVAAMLVTEDLMISMPAMLLLKDNQTWRPIRRARNFASRGAWEEQRSILAHVLSVDGFISLSAAFEGLANASGVAAEHADEDPLTDEEGWALASTFLAMNRGLSHLTLLVHMPSRLRQIKRHRFRREQQEHVNQLLGKDKPYQDSCPSMVAERDHRIPMNLLAAR